MVIDLRAASDSLNLISDVCIVGAGAAGNTLARALLSRGVDVCLLESGGLDFESDTQSLYQGENIGMEYYDLDHARLRFYGGTTNIWGGRVVPLDPIDFKHRDWVPHSGWPISFEDLKPWYEIAHNALDLGAFDYSEKVWRSLGKSPIDFNPDEIKTTFWRFDVMEERFNPRKAADVMSAKNMQVVLHANATHLQTNPNGSHLDFVQARSLNGNRAEIRAKHFVLACGAIENARLLLMSNDVQSCGLGNERDQVGRYFMEHPHGRIAHIETNDPAEFWALYRKRFPATGTPVAPALVVSEELQEHKRILNGAATFKLQRPPEYGLGLSKKTYLNLKHALSPSRSGRGAWHIYRRIQDQLQRHLSMRLLRLGVKARGMGLYLMSRAEQAPNPNSRICLSTELDALGKPRADLDWRLSRLDKSSALELGEAVKREFRRLELGEVTTMDWLRDDSVSWPLDPTVGNHPIGGYHHMGTTRMSETERSGVVDSNCTLHGCENLHIAGSSVFTTSGWANPTLTILALAYRLSDHLCRQLEKTN
jgi:choline dehydrogenase-like flavoprotein